MKRADPNRTEGQPINVYARIRPFNKQEIKKNCVETVSFKKNKELHVKQTYCDKIYTFEHIFGPNSNQTDVFNVTVEPLIHEVLKGYNCTIFAYGQTGSGKTHTIVGEVDEKAGIIPRSVEKIFELLEKTNKDSSVLVSFLELYNEELFDLLSLDLDPKNIKIFDDKDKKNSVLVYGLEEINVSFKNEVFQLLERGYAKRRTAATLVNANSSRSHTVFTVTVHMREKSVKGEDMVKTGKLNLVDLAGSENIGKSGSVDKRAREAGSINQSLLTLGRVIKALTENTMHVPYRESKLTRILQDSLGGRAKTSLIATISSAQINLEETISTLEYAIRVRSIQNKPEINLQLSRSALVKEYQQELKKLKSELQRCRKGNVIYVNEENYTQMITDKENFSSELDLKNEYIKGLENKLTETTANLELVQKSWTDTANNIEALVRQKNILEEDLIATSNQKEQDRAELENFKAKHWKIKENAKVLVSTAEIHTRNEEILHNKVNFLYGASHNNVKSLKAFRCLYDNISTKMVNIVDECLHSCDNLNETTEINANFKNKLNEGRNKLLENLQELSVVCQCLDDFKNKQSVTERVPEYLHELRNIADNAFTIINATLTKFSAIFSENARQIIQEIGVDSGNRYKQFIVNTLCHLRDGIINTNINIYELVDKSQEEIQEKCQKVEKLTEKLKYKLAKHEKLTGEIDKEGNEKLNRLLDLVDKFEKKYAPFHNTFCEELEKSTEISRHSYDSSAAMSSMFLETVSTLKNKIESFTLQIQTSLEQAVKLKEFMQEDITLRNSAVNLIEKSRMNMQDIDVQVTRAFKQLRQDISEHGKNIQNRERLCKNLAQTVSETQQKVTDTTSSASIKIDDTYETFTDVLENAKTSMADGLNKILSASRSYEKYSEKMKREVEEFCNLKVPHVIHGGDTPPCRQKVNC